MCSGSIQINLECICKYRNGSTRFEIFIFVHIASIDFYLPGYIYIINGFLQIIFVMILLLKTNKIRIQPQTFAKTDPQTISKNQPRLGYWFFKNPKIEFVRNVLRWMSNWYFFQKKNGMNMDHVFNMLIITYIQHRSVLWFVRLTWMEHLLKLFYFYKVPIIQHGTWEEGFGRYQCVFWYSVPFFDSWNSIAKLNLNFSLPPVPP